MHLAVEEDTTHRCCMHVVLCVSLPFVVNWVDRIFMVREWILLLRRFGQTDGHSNVHTEFNLLWRFSLVFMTWS